MSDHTQTRPLGEKLKILVAVRVPEPEQISPLLIELYRPLRVCLLGLYAVPEQTAPEQAREQFGDEAAASLRQVAGAFRESGVEVETELVFTADELQTVERVVVERDCHAVVLLKPTYELRSILAALRPGPMATRILHFLAELLRDTDYRATLLYVPGKADEDEGREEARRELELLQRELLEQGGVGEEQVQLELETADREEVVVEAADRHDVVLIGETEPSIREEVFGDFSRRLADEADVPVIVVRREL
jgi:nucleotide-binding universal stress UspA family protein